MGVELAGYFFLFYKLSLHLIDNFICCAEGLKFHIIYLSNLGPVSCGVGILFRNLLLVLIFYSVSLSSFSVCDVKSRYSIWFVELCPGWEIWVSSPICLNGSFSSACFCKNYVSKLGIILGSHFLSWSM